MGTNREVVNGGCFGALLGRVDGCRLALHHVAVDATFGVRGLVGLLEDDLSVRFVLRQHQFIGPVAVQREITKVGMRCVESPLACMARLCLDQGFRAAALIPCIAKPEGWQHGKLGRLIGAIVHRDLDQQIFGASLGVLHFNVAVVIRVEDPRIDQFVFRLQSRAAAVGCNKVVIGIGTQGIFVEVTHVGMRWR